MDACEWNCILEITGVLSWTVLECCEGVNGHLEKNEEYEFPEDSDYESECEEDGGPVSGGAQEVDYDQGQKPLSVLKIGSLIGSACSTLSFIISC